MLAYAVAVPLTVVPALAVVGTLLYDVPYVGMAAAFVPWFLVWLIVAAAIGAALAGYRWWRRRGRFAATLTVVALLAVAGGSFVTARMTAAVDAAGADVDLVSLFDIRPSSSVPPDAEATYTTFEGEPLQLSIYRPPGSTAQSRAPVLVYVHGGGWIAGDPQSRSTDLRWLADHGWLTISVGYSLSSQDRHLADVTQGQLGCALTWIGANAHRYGGDPTRLSISGHSAGGNLAINTAYQAAAGTLPSSCGGRPPAVHAVSAMYPAVDPAGLYRNDDPVVGGAARDMVAAYTGGSPEQFPQRYQRISSASHITADAPPTLIILPEADHLAPAEDTYRFDEQAAAAGVDVELVAVPFADHVFDARPGSIGQQAFRQLTARWLRDHGQGP
ncbi:alpha/beta hydrolase [Mycolicibacterium pulveris]|uniref:alpha/beta hydrolase n=1 Tax=Mycolicibacterium pulveris TaxID=36813 RepID=UPI003CEAEBB7